MPTPSTISGYALKSILINYIDTDNASDATDASVTEGCTYGMSLKYPSDQSSQIYYAYTGC